MADRTNLHGIGRWPPPSLQADPRGIAAHPVTALLGDSNLPIQLGALAPFRAMDPVR
ncbi:hypothetical protein [Sphingomonas oryzagri]